MAAATRNAKLRYGVVSTFYPRAAAQKTFEPHKSTFKHAVPLDCGFGIRRAGRSIYA